MAEEIIMPKLSMTMEEGVITEWHKNEGDEVKRGELLLTVESDKANLEVEAEAEGILLKKIHAEGDTVPVTEIIGVIGEAGEDISRFLQEQGAEEPAAEEDAAVPAAEASADKAEPAAVTTDIEKIKASPAARRLAREAGINLKSISGSGPNGRIIEQDIQQYADDQPEVKATPTARKIAAEQGISLEDVAGERGQRLYKQDVLDYAGSTAARTEELRGFKRVAARKLTQSWTEIPHVTLTMEADTGRALELVERINENAEDDAKISITDILIKACASALKEYPLMNAILDGETIHYNENVNVSLAVAVGDELVVPGLKNVDRKGLKDITREKRELVKKARNNSLSQEDISNNYFTISNLGMFGVETFTPIINPPGSGILGVGKIKKKPVEANGEVVFLPMMWLSLSFDHRLINGVPGAKFLSLVKDIIEKPELLLY